jgi:thiol:disulfide interchange protein DsbD
MPVCLEKWLARLSHHQKSGHYLGVIIMGCLATLIVSPCVTPALVGALAYISQTGHALLGASALFMMGLGMGVPLLVIGVAHGKWLPKTGAWMTHVQRFFGLAMLGVAIGLLSRLLPDRVTLLLSACLLIAFGLFLNPWYQAVRYAQRCLRLVAGLIVVYGLLLLGSVVFNQPAFSYFLTNGSWTVPVKADFQRVKTVREVQQALQRVAGKQVTFLDFYADWCIACKRMEKTTFADPRVKAALADMQRLQANVTANDADDKALEKQWGVIAPPTLLFFDKNGSEIIGMRQVGEVSAAQLLAELKTHEAVLSGR